MGNIPLKANSASYLDLMSSFNDNGNITTLLYETCDDFNIKGTNFPFLIGSIPWSLAYGVFISQLIRYSRVSSSYNNCDVWILIWGFGLDFHLLISYLYNIIDKLS